MSWKRQSLRHSIAAKKGWMKRKLKKRAKRYVVRKTISSAVGMPGADDLLELNDSRD